MTKILIAEDEPVYTFGTVLELSGTCKYPDDRAGDRYEITLSASSATPQDLRLKIKDLHLKDTDGCLQYRKYRGIDYPVYAEPPAFAFLEKVRGEKLWTVWMQVAPQMVSDGLVILSGNKSVYVSIHEKKVDRHRQVRSLTVQTTDPAEE